MPKFRKITERQFSNVKRFEVKANGRMADGRFPFKVAPRWREVVNGDCTLRAKDGYFVMTAVDGHNENGSLRVVGRHQIAIDCTDLDRLNAHWKGFVNYHNAEG